MQKNQYLFVILLFFSLVYLLPLGARPLMVPDETRYAEIPREMVASGNWVAPHLNGLKYYEKPVMGYWVHALSQKILGENNFSVRFPCGLSAGLIVILMMVMVSSSVGRQDSRVYLPPLIYLSSFGVFLLTTIAILDNVLNFFLTASIVFFFLATEKIPRSTSEKILLVLAGIFIACAFMTKGFLAFVVPVVTVIPYLFWQMRAREIFRLLLWPALTAIVVSLPWAIMIHLEDPEFWNFFFWHEHVKRFFADNAQHHEPFWFYFATILPMLLPWVLLVPSTFSGLTSDVNKDQKLSRLIAYCSCWFIFPLLFFSASNGKLITYILPCFPPLAILIGIGLYGAAKENKKWIGIGLFGFIIFAILAFSGLLATQFLSLNLFTLPESLLKYDAESLRYSDKAWKPAILLLSLTWMTGFAIWAWRSKNGEKKLLLTALAPAALMISLSFALPDLTLKVKAPGLFLEKEGGDIPKDAVVLADSSIITAACWYLKRDDITLIIGAGELHYGIAQPGQKHRLLDFQGIKDLVNSDRDKPVYMMLDKKRWNRYRKLFPDPKELINAEGKYGFTIAVY
jgi:4-amino-4-deoxy-L-arabinose transferase